MEVGGTILALILLIASVSRRRQNHYFTSNSGPSTDFLIYFVKRGKRKSGFAEDKTLIIFTFHVLTPQTG